MSCPHSLSQVSRYEWLIVEDLLVFPRFDFSCTKTFKLHNHSWEHLAMYSSDSDQLRILISCVDFDVLNLDFFFHVRFGIIDDTKTELVALNGIGHFASKKIKDYYTRVCSTTNKTLYFFIEVEKENHPKAWNVASKRKLEDDYEELLISGTYSDMIIEVKNKKFKCHKNILKARCPVFSAMLTHDMKEKASGVMVIDDTDPSVFEQFLRYLYTGSCDHLSWRNLADLHKLGDKYAMEEFKMICLEHMKQNITLETFFAYFEVSQLHNELDLEEKTVEFFLKNSIEIMENENWLSFLTRISIQGCNILMKALARSKI